MEHSTCPLTFTHRSKRQSSRFFAKRESRQTKLRLEVSSSDAARPRHSRLAASGSESSLLLYLVSPMDWTESSRASKSRRPSSAMGASSRRFARVFVVDGHRFSIVAKRPVSERVLFFHIAHRIALIGSLCETPDEDG